MFSISACNTPVTLVTSKRYKVTSVYALQGEISKDINALQGVQNEIENTEPLNEQRGEKCLCGRWGDYARVDGGWAASNMEYERGETGDHGCENIAAGDSVTHARMCLLCQAGPVDECNEAGTILTCSESVACAATGGRTGQVM